MPKRFLRFAPLLVFGLAAIPVLVSFALGSWSKPNPPASPTPTDLKALPTPVPSGADLLQQSWLAYRQRFIQPDGRVIDFEAGDRSTSEGQAYALLRAVLIDDPATFERSLTWAENNLQRKNASGQRRDQLWGWQWGRLPEGGWGFLDANFASDADVDAITALILASRRWNRPDYLALARAKLQDLWALSTVPVGQQRYLLPGPAAAFQVGRTGLQLNPSYFAPHAFRLFAQVDPAHDWQGLADSSYQALDQLSALSQVGLPGDWVILDTATGQFQPLPPDLDPEGHSSRYSFDAYRVWWRVALDAHWFQSPQAQTYLRRHLGHLQQVWQKEQKIPARIDLRGQPTVTYEATAQYGMLYAALKLIDPAMAEQIQQQKLMPQYRSGFWDSNSAYYTQNLVWLGLAAPTQLPPEWLKPQ